MRSLIDKIFRKKYFQYNKNDICLAAYGYPSDLKSIYTIENYLSDFNDYSFSNDANTYIHEMEENITQNKFKRISIDELVNENKKFDIKSIPFYQEDDLPTYLTFDNNNELFLVSYININGLGGLLRHNVLLPVQYEIVNNKISKEFYSLYLFCDDGKEVNRHGLRYCKGVESCYARPTYVSYDEFGFINPKKSFWSLGVLSQDNTDVISHSEYKELLKPININPDNFKLFSEQDVKIIKYYLMLSYKPKDFSDICSKEDVPKYLDILRIISF